MALPKNLQFLHGLLRLRISICAAAMRCICMTLLRK